MRWGLIPSSSKSLTGRPLFNARSETVAEKPSFRTAFRRRGGLIPADGFYERQALTSKQKQPHYITLRTGQPFAFAGFSLFFHHFSTFVGKPDLYVEDVYVRPAYRRKGIGLTLFKHLAGIAIVRDCGRMEWSVLDWNTPAIEFSQSRGAVPINKWTIQRLTGESLHDLAKSTSDKSDG